MKQGILALTALIVCCGSALAGETLDAAAVVKLITGNTVHVLRSDGTTIKNYFSTDGKVIRYENGNTSEGTWQVKDDGTHCVEGIAGGCARIMKNGDGSYDRVQPWSKAAITWTAVVNGKDF